MAKKIFALVMVMSILGGILAGCSGGSSDSTTPPAGPDATKTDAGTGDAATK